MFSGWHESSASRITSAITSLCSPNTPDPSSLNITFPNVSSPPPPDWWWEGLVSRAIVRRVNESGLQQGHGSAGGSPHQVSVGEVSVECAAATESLVLDSLDRATSALRREEAPGGNTTRKMKKWRLGGMLSVESQSTMMEISAWILRCGIHEN
jgi:hypothetical protein